MIANQNQIVAFQNMLRSFPKEAVVLSPTTTDENKVASTNSQGQGQIAAFQNMLKELMNY